MSARTLPGSIPGLLRRGSPVITDGECRRTIHGIDLAYGARIFSALSVPRWASLAELALDLTDHTGRWHAALWIVAAGALDARWRGLTAAELELVEKIAWGEDCDDEDVTELRDLALEVHALLSVPHAG